MATGGPNNVNRDPYPPVNRDWTGYGCGWLWFLWLIIILIIIFGGWGWYGGWWGWNGRGWSGRGEPQVREPVPSGKVQAPNANGTASTEFLDRTVTLSGQVADVINPKAFTLKAGSNNGGSLLIVATENPKPAVTKGETVEVTGTVHRFNRSEIQQETHADLSNAVFGEFTGQLVIIASKVSTKQG